MKNINQLISSGDSVQTNKISIKNFNIENKKLLQYESSRCSIHNFKVNRVIEFSIIKKYYLKQTKKALIKTEYNNDNNSIFNTKNNQNLINNSNDSKKNLFNHRKHSIKSSENQNLIDERKIVLVIDDHKYVRESMSNLIKKIIKKKNLENKFKVKEGIDGSELIYYIIKDQMENNKIKCIITDENMEFINGSEAIKILKNLEKNNQIRPLIIASCTAFEDEYSKYIIKSSGANYFLSKPCNEFKLNKFFDEFQILEKKDVE